MFEKLLLLAPFQGLCKDHLTEILEKTKLHFTKHRPDEILIENNKPCKELFIILDGEIMIDRKSVDGNYSVIEKIKAPFIIEPEALFGIKTFYKATYISNSQVSGLIINKNDILNHLLEYEIFRINYLNIIDTKAQNLYYKNLTLPKNDIRSLIINFIWKQIEVNHGEKIIKIKMDDLAYYINQTRLNVSKELNSMQSENLIVLGRKNITIPEVSLLLNL